MSSSNHAAQGRISFKEQMRGFPIWQIGVVSVLRFLEPIAFTSLFPYIYFMIRDFNIVDNEADISKYSGYLAASFAFTQFLCSIHWGRASEKVGRKPILLLGLFGTSVCMLLFGFSTNFYMALFARSAMGALNGNIGVLRTMLGEIATERRHQAMAFSTLPLLWNVGTVVGPLIGGSKYFTRPKTGVILAFSLGSLYDSFLNKYPYALSNVVVALFLWTSMVIGFLFLEETHPKLWKRRDRGLEVGDWIRRSMGFEVHERPWQLDAIKLGVYHGDTAVPYDAAHGSTTGSSDEVVNSDALSENALIESSINEESSLNRPTAIYSSVYDEDEDDDEQDNFAIGGPLSSRTSNAIIRRYSSGASIGDPLSRMTTGEFSMTDNGGFSSIFSREVFTGPVIQTIANNFSVSFHSLVCSEFIPVFLASKYDPSQLKFPTKLKGGFGYDSNTIGNLLSITGLFGVLIVLFVFPYMDRTMKTITGFRYSCSIFLPTYALLPFIIYTTHGYNPLFSEGTALKLLYLNSAIRTLASATAFPQIMVLIHRASPPKHRALINGLTISLTAFARFLAPLIWGYLMSFFDLLALGQVSWLILAVIAGLTWLQAFLMEEYNEDLKQEQRRMPNTSEDA